MESQPIKSTLSGAENPMTPASQPSYTILRIKRKRNEEPLDALVVESRVPRKKSRGGVGMFQYAQTVEESDWAARQKEIQDEISRLARETAAKATSEVLENVPPAAEPQFPGSPARVPRSDPHTVPAASRRYTIVDSDPEPKVTSKRYPTVPPTVYSYKELEARKNGQDFKMYDAVPSSAATPMAVDDSSDMDHFLPMLNDYLSIHDVSNDTPTLQKSSSASSPSKNKKPIADVEDDDYVWDVFYHRPATLSEWNSVANIGTVTGLPPSFGEAYDSASDSEEELDEADEDSNAEDFYKNDYPDEEDPSSDEWHESSDYDDVMNYHDEEEQFDWR